MEQELSCEQVIEQLLAYLDGELGEQSRAAIDRHLSRCRECYSRAEFERKLREKLQEAARVPAPARLRARIDDLLNEY
ncbi:anti-sigma factor family protein [Alkalilimnicola ehrlichii MLHE-1]|uniref:Putative transmembrane anti-sigma factor n=1 Tax=Alkalilimnicola ehrlichii (strain ATCC BAA-1101 / DSM 17681 / MLHE-1) TaxID=187272 RepID=Q0A856_ALKEH|nr:zf-HC2 domain-containing protein [Alkalilimnicola ehrlichii]ABI56981.1 putative transmembrane anti-sigma factor [Alkalilimnicola ehrlichii MLHE-1]